MNAPEAIGGVIDRIDPGGAPERRAGVSKADWAAAVGVRIAERTTPIELEGGLLTVRVATSVWASELSLLATPILARLQARGVEVQALRYRVGVIEAPRQTKALRESRSVPAPVPLPSDLEDMIAGVADEELRASIAGAARSNLAWQSYVRAGEPEAAAGGSRRVTVGASRAARVPRSAAPGTDQPDQTTGAAPGASRRKP